MTPDLRRRLAALLAGVAGTLVALLAVTVLRARACRDAGGRWADAARACTLPPGADEPAAATAWLLGALAGVAAMLVLWRTYTFFALRARTTGAPAPGRQAR